MGFDVCHLLVTYSSLFMAVVSHIIVYATCMPPVCHLFRSMAAIGDIASQSTIVRIRMRVADRLKLEAEAALSTD